jgi:hypothetical protein
MRKLALAAVAVGAISAATVAPAEARWGGGWHGGWALVLALDLQPVLWLLEPLQQLHHTTTALATIPDTMVIMARHPMPITARRGYYGPRYYRPWGPYYGY